MTSAVPIPQAEVAALCRRYHVERLALFGSVLRDDSHPASDVDILVEFQPGKTPGLAFIDLQDALADLLGRRVYLNTPASLSPYLRHEVLKEAEPVYVSA